MDIVNRVLFLVLLIFLFVSGDSAFATNEVYVLGGLNYGSGIVADSTEWECSYGIGKSCIVGFSKKFPMSFTYHVDVVHVFNKENVMTFAEDYLKNLAQKSSTVFSSVSLEKEGDAYYIIDGAYFNNSYSGGFALYVQNIPTTRTCYVMFIELKESVRGDLLDDETRNNLYQEAIDLITPLYSPK